MPQTSSANPRVTPAGAVWHRLGLVALAGLVLSLASLFVMRDAERLRAEDALGYMATDITGEIANRIGNVQSTVLQVRALYAASDDVTRPEFHAFTETLLAQDVGVYWLAWVPAVAPAAVDALVDAARRDGVRDYLVRDLPLQRQATATRPPWRAPVAYLEPSGYANALGVDLSSAPEWAAALVGVSEAREARVIALRPLSYDASTAAALTVVVPIYPHDTPAAAGGGAPTALQGFLVAQADASRAIPDVGSAALQVEIRDAGGRLVASRQIPPDAAGGEAPLSVELKQTQPLPLGDATWQVAVTPGPAFIAARRTVIPWLASAAGLLLTLLGTLYVHSLMRATQRATRMAADLLASKEALERETSERHLLEERIRQAQKMEAMGTLAGGIAHDFNNILSAILGYTDLAMADVPPDGPVHGYLTEVAQAGRRAGDLVAQILAFSRKTGRERRPIRLHAVVKEAVKLLRGSIPPTIEIRDDIDAACQAVKADPTEVHQVVMNLCTNAYHAMRGHGGALVVAMRPAVIQPGEAAQDPRLRPGTYVRLTVSDTGHGMSPETLQRVFEPYFTTQEPGRGTGLGLSTVHGLVEAMGGVIHAYSELGQGSTFNVFLPAIAEELSEQDLSGASLLAQRGDERVLIVDDEEAIITFAKTALERMGYRVTVRAQSPEALALFERDPGQFDVVVTDQMMPKMRGSELSRRLRELRPDLPIILCSGFGDVLDAQHEDHGLFAARVMKPIVATDLAKAIRSVMDGLAAPAEPATGPTDAA